MKAPIPPSSKVPIPLSPKPAPSAVLAKLVKNKLALIEDFALGLYDHKPPFNDPKVGYMAFICILASFHMNAYKITSTFLYRPVPTLFICAMIGLPLQSPPNVVLSSSVKHPCMTVEANDKGRKTDTKGKGKQKQQSPKPSGNNNPHPTNNILALIPESADKRPRNVQSLNAMDQCAVCGATNVRVMSVNGTFRVEHCCATDPKSSASNENPPTILHGNGEDAEHSATYMVSEHVVKSPEAKAQWLHAKDADEAFKTLLDQDKEVMKVVITTREFA
ncbi:hypothetical protein ARMGADRAFT_1040619 [Armillaria gallica]|uniref:Uncharacterized protein n=1 Tax=Armillaria gallica TaxID=47427 RepID=A0A2H3CSF2_ARMGA|nr:hypothetical protein ARMGADRAFT_1040619 [Armillaria gallica]